MRNTCSWCIAGTRRPPQVPVVALNLIQQQAELQGSLLLLTAPTVVLAAADAQTGPP